jgi:hypothetical protein
MAAYVLTPEQERRKLALRELSESQATPLEMGRKVLQEVMEEFDFVEKTNKIAKLTAAKRDRDEARKKERQSEAGWSSWREGQSGDWSWTSREGSSSRN